MKGLGKMSLEGKLIDSFPLLTRRQHQLKTILLQLQFTVINGFFIVTGTLCITPFVRVFPVGVALSVHSLKLKQKKTQSVSLNHR